MKTFKFTLKVWSSIAFILLALSFTAVPAEARNDRGKAKYIFLFIGDGMGASHVAAAESYLSYKAGKLGGEQLTFTQFPVVGLQYTQDSTSFCPDSASTATSLSSGFKTHSGVIGMGDDAEPGMAESTVHLSFDRTAIECVAAAAYAVRGRKEYRDAVCNALPDPLLVGLDRLYAFVLQGYDGKPVILICRKRNPVIMYRDHGSIIS